MHVVTSGLDTANATALIYNENNNSIVADIFLMCWSWFSL